MIIEDTVIRIDLKKLARNFDKVRAMVTDDVAIMAVIKANGYGHGMLEVAPTMMEHGAAYLAVARLGEAMRLREKYPDYPLFVLGFTPDRLLPVAVENNIALTCFSSRQAKILGDAAKALNRRAVVHLKIETGLNRLGSDDVDELDRICRTEGVYVEGIYSHLAQKNHALDEIQMEKFMRIIAELEARGASFRYKHIADSIVCVDYPDFRLNMIRPGAILFGMKSYDDPNFVVEPILSMETRIARLRRLSVGEGVCYDLRWVAKRPSLIATLPFGYSDGYPIQMFGKGYVTIRGIKCPLVGKLCMDQCMADVTDVPGVEEGDLVMIYGDGSNNTMSIKEAAAILDTNKNGLLAQLMQRPARVYEK